MPSDKHVHGGQDQTCNTTVLQTTMIKILGTKHAVWG